MPTDNNRDIRVSGRRKAFEVGRFVLAIMVHAEALAEAEAMADGTTERSATEASPASEGTSTIWQRPRQKRRASSGGAAGSAPSAANPFPDDEEAA